MKRNLKYIALLIVYGLSILGYLKMVELQNYKVSLNQSLEIHFESIVVLANINLNYLDQFEREGFLSINDYQKIGDNHSMVLITLQNMESIKLLQESPEKRGNMKRSNQAYDMNAYIDNFSYEKNNDDDVSDEFLRSYYNQLKDRISALMDKKGEPKWTDEVKMFLNSGGEGVWIDD